MEGFAKTCLCICLVFSEFLITDAVVNTQYGPVEGEVINVGGSPVTRYLGIPYAKPPTGERRFMPPEEPDPWTDTLQTTQFGDSCMQASQFLPQGSTIDEDCLFLNVYAPEGDNMAVMVWIHGGSLVFGSSLQYPAEYLATYGNVVVVIINYRLGVFGFLSTGDDVVEGNAGLMDQVQALKWVQNNIEQFGGDKNRVTIFGESAGAWSVELHLVSPMSRGLFQRAICQSGALHGVPLESGQERLDGVRRLAASVACVQDDTLLMITCLQEVEADDLLQGSMQPPPNDIAAFFPATIGGSFLPHSQDYYWDRYEEFGEHVDIMVGVNSGEGLLALMTLPTADHIRRTLTEGISTTDTFYPAFIGLAAGGVLRAGTVLAEDPVWEVVMDQYTPNTEDKVHNINHLLQLISDSFFLAPTLRTIQTVAVTDKKAYLYYFDYVNDFGPSDGSEITPGVSQYYPTLNPDIPVGATHSAEIVFVFGLSGVQGLTNASKAMDIAMMSAWTSFAKTGEPIYKTPDGSELPWPEYDVTGQRYLEFTHPMSEKSAKNRLLPTATSFFTKLLPAFNASLETIECPESSVGIRTTSDMAKIIFLATAVYLIKAMGYA